jgi:ketosteroid isomerase-like protein
MQAMIYKTKKMNKQIIFSIITILLLISSCGKKADEQKEAETIKAVLTDMWDAIEKHDINRYAKYIHPDFTQFGETDSVLRAGKTAEVNAIKDWTLHASNVHTEMIEPKITVKNNVAWIVYYWQDAGMNDGKPFTSRGKSTRIFIKEDNQWQCIHGHYTLLP